MSSRTSCMRPPVMMSPPKANNLSTGSSPEPQITPPIGEPEIKSISFQESLRFFQEQFIKSSASSSSRNLHPLKIRLRPTFTKGGEPKAETDKISPREQDEEMSVNFTSSEIQPIPTVETILESVRILRAIQRSQAQGGALWTLECDDASLNCDMSQLDSILSLDSGVNENGNSDGFSSLDSSVTNTNGISDTMNGLDKNQSPCLIPGLNREELESKVNNLCAFWPRAVVNMVKQNVDLNNLMLLDDKCNDLNAERLSKNVAEDMCNKVNAAVRECMNISLPPDACEKGAILKDSSAAENPMEYISSVGNGKDCLNALNNEPESMDSCVCNASITSSYQNDHVNTCGILAGDLAGEYVSCSSLFTLQEQLTGNRTDVGDRSPSALDSGIATDKSLDSYSPTSALSHFADTEGSGGSWTESSHYDSAEGTPFASFSDVAIAQSLPDDLTCISVNDANIGSKNVNNARQESPVCDSPSDEQGSGLCEGNLDDTDVDFDTCNSSLCETDNAASPELSERDLLMCSPYQPDRSISPKLSGDSQRDRLLDIIEDHPKSLEDIQRDRLLEIVEDSIHQVEFVPSEVKGAAWENRVDNCKHCEDTEPQNVTSTSSMAAKPSVPLENGIHDGSNVNNLDFGNINDVMTTDRSSLLHTQCETAVTKSEAVEHPTACDNVKSDNLCEANDGAVGVENQDAHLDAVVSQPNDIIVENQVCVSEIECTLSKASESVVHVENDVESVDERPKKAPTLSWDPVLLLQHLYKLEQHSVYQHVQPSDEKHCGMLRILPFGTFSEDGGLYYVVLEKNFFYCYESSEELEPLLRIPLQYATVKMCDQHTVVLDNRQGRCIHMKFESEGSLDEWCTALEAHSIPCLPSKYVEPVHYPLKCHKDVIIVDLGSCSTRAGILMDQPTLPSVYFPTVCASDKKTNQQIYGLEALFPEVRQNSVLSFPVRTSAKVTKFTMDIEALKGLFGKIFHELGVDPSTFTLEICIPRALSIQTQAALVKLLLEDLRVKAVSLTRQALLTLYAHDTSTGIVVDIGDRMDILPVVDGFILETGVSRLPYGGQRIIHHLKYALAQRHISLSNEVESYLVQYIMENLCYIAEDYEKELQYAASFPESVRKSVPLHPFFQKDNTLHNVSLDTGRFQVPEGLFNPDLWGLDSPGLHKLVHQAIQSSGVDVRRHITESIYVSGGVTLLPGFVERLEAEISKLTLPRLKPQIHASPYRNHMAYLGACKLAASDAFPQVCVTAEDWMQEGPRCLKKWHL